MIFGGFQKNSMIDFPGKIAALVFTQGCNFHCPYCHNPALIAMKGKQNISEEEVLLFLKKRKGLIEGLAITGGEPTLQKNLPDFCEKVKAMGFPIKLDTNGSRPEVLRGLLTAGLLDCIAMDIKTLPSEYAPLLSDHSMEHALETSIRLIIESGIDHEFRTTCVFPFISEEKAKSLVPLIRGARRFALQSFSDTSLYNPDFFNKKGRGLDDHEINRIKTVLSPHTESFIIR
ncbi:anaerobic ribonucleoside-triphosphate reductase activating protein [Desulfobotulus sp. H1]|uniref:Anaerobic ribonucleoside-triphosphate reductase activating protein n=1 Tax=Desulfobotulus pelophilus TaxID=2823377 RepID=A0ABT3N6W3_9BACT|nr:anaerobic ribonucleoside-triphosphate reductase activating protein [Desulfobotulus pelophilus]MCW7753201.1 anaerobic ribonucleoside-triphosphate reductase activating protein [Desulfobotulus pelophilus]